MSTSDRLDAFADTLERHLGKRARREAGPILLDMLRGYYAVVHLGELPADAQRQRLVVRIARELERAAREDAGAAAAGARQADEISVAVHTPPRVY